MEYSLPKDIYAKSYGGLMLVISPSSGNWIVLDSQCQVDIFRSMVNGLTLQEIHERFSGFESEIEKVITEIEGRNFVHSTVEEEEGFTLRLYVTNKCNLRCRHCFMYAAEALKHELALWEICKLLEQARKYGCVKLILTGGEVLMCKDLGEIVKYADTLGLYIQVLTNGTLWTEARVKELAPYIDEIQVSIDGFNEDTNAEIRGMDSFTPAMNTLDMFAEYPEVMSSAVITPSYGGLEYYRKEYTEFAQCLTERYRDKNFLVVIQRELIDGRNIKADPERNRKMNETVKDMYEEIYPNSELTSFVMNHRGGRIFRNCGWGNLTVNSNGDTYFCGRINDVKKYANIREQSFDEIMRTRKLMRKLSSVDYVMPCRECALRYICGGGCRINNFPDIAKADAEYLINHLLVRHTECTEEYKNNLYRLMIEADKFLME